MINAPPPSITALADQFIAAAQDQMRITVDMMADLLATNPPNVEFELARIACVLDQLCEDPKARENVVAGYVAAIYELARLYERINK